MYPEKIKKRLKKQLMEDIPEDAWNINFIFNKYDVDIRYSIDNFICFKPAIKLDFIKLAYQATNNPFHKIFIKLISLNKKLREVTNKNIADKLWEDKHGL